MNAGQTAAYFDGPGARRLYFSVTAVVILPMGVGFCAGIYTGLIATGFVLVMGVDLRYALIPAGIAAAVAWLLALRWVRDMNRDLNQALWTIAHGKMESERIMTVENHLPDGRTTTRTDLGISYETLVRVGRRILDGATISQGSMLDLFGGSRREFQLFQVKLVAAGWAKWRSEYAPQQGMSITDKGMQEFQRACDSGVPLPRPPADFSQINGMSTRTRAHADGYSVYDD